MIRKEGMIRKKGRNDNEGSIRKERMKDKEGRNDKEG